MHGCVVVSKILSCCSLVFFVRFPFFFSNLVWVIFGPSLSLFATWTASFVTMTRVALGEFDNIYPLMVEVNDAAAIIIIITYQVFQVGGSLCIHDNVNTFRFCLCSLVR